MHRAFIYYMNTLLTRIEKIKNCVFTMLTFLLKNLNIFATSE